MTMKTKRLALPLAALVALASFTGAASADEKRSFGCAYQDSVDSKELSSRTQHIIMNKILREYMTRWDADYMRAQCKAFADGKPYQISCLRGQRDWDAITALVPGELWGMSRENALPHLRELEAADDGHKAALEYCREVGAIPKKWSMK